MNYFNWVTLSNYFEISLNLIDYATIKLVNKYTYVWTAIQFESKSWVSSCFLYRDAYNSSNQWLCEPVVRSFLGTNEILLKNQQ